MPLVLIIIGSILLVGYIVVGFVAANSIVEKTQDDDPSLTAFSIKLYLTKYYQDVSTLNSYNGTFQPIGMTEAEKIQEYIKDIKSLQHDFVSLKISILLFAI